MFLFEKLPQDNKPVVCSLAWGSVEDVFGIAYQSCLSSTLHTIKANEERCRLLPLRSVQLPMLRDSIENKWHAVLGFVVNDLRHSVNS